MAKARHANYADELREQRAAWERKPSLQAVYHGWYRQIVSRLAPMEPTIEIGSGCGNFKAFCPAVIATDAIAGGPWIDQIVDARALPFAAGSVGNLVLIDCLHHLSRPIDFLAAASNCLQPGGRIVVFEPAATWWARWVWALCHHEPVDLQQDFLAEAGTPPPEDPGFQYANMGTAEVLFARQREAVLARLPQLELLEVRRSDCLLYPATGGFSYFNLVPAGCADFCHRWEQRLIPGWCWRWLGLRMLIVLSRR